MKSKFHIYTVSLLSFMLYSAAMAQVQLPSNSYKKTYEQKNPSLKYSYDEASQTHNYSNNWDFDQDGIKDELYFVGTSGAHLYYFLRVVLSADKKVQDFTFLESDLPALPSEEKLNRIDYNPKNEDDPFTVLDRNNTKMIILKIDHPTFRVNHKLLARKGIKTKLISLTFKNRKALLKDF